MEKPYDHQHGTLVKVEIDGQTVVGKVTPNWNGGESNVFCVDFELPDGRKYQQQRFSRKTGLFYKGRGASAARDLQTAKVVTDVKADLISKLPWRRVDAGELAGMAADFDKQAIDRGFDFRVEDGTESIKFLSRETGLVIGTFTQGEDESPLKFFARVKEQFLMRGGTPAAAEPVNVTSKELAVLFGVARSEYQGADYNDASIIGVPVWTFSVEGPETNRVGVKGNALSGVISSLVEKGLVGVDADTADRGKSEPVIWLTQAGFDAINVAIDEFETPEQKLATIVRPLVEKAFGDLDALALDLATHLIATLPAGGDPRDLVGKAAELKFSIDDAVVRTAAANAAEGVGPLPRIEKESTGTFLVFDPTTGKLAAVFHNEQFLRTVLIQVFGHSEFEGIPITPRPTGDPLDPRPATPHFNSPDSAVNRLWRDRNRPADQPKTDDGPAVGWKG